MSLFNADGKVNVTVVAGTSYTGLYAADGSINVVVDDTSHFGVIHPCGAYRLNSTDGISYYDPSGAIYANRLLGSGADPADLGDNIAARAPTAADDITRGNTVGRRWLDLTTGNFYVNTYNAAGVASWTNEGPTTGLPIEASGISWAAAYGVKSLTSSWLTGNLFDVFRTSDSAILTVAAVAGEPNVTAVETFLSGTTGFLSKWYDQSGNARHITSVGGTGGLIIRIVDGRISISGANIVEQGLSGSGGYLAIPSSSTNLQALTAIAVTRAFQSVPIPNTSASSSTKQFFGTYNGSSAGVIFKQALDGTSYAGQNQLIELSFFSPYRLDGAVETNYAVTGFTASASNMLMFQNEQTTTASANTAATYSAGFGIGGANNGSGQWALNDELQAVMFTGAASISSATALAVRKSLYTLFEIVPQYTNDNYVSVGDSITQGYQASSQGGQGWSSTTQIQDLVSRPIRVSNYGVSQANIPYHTSKNWFYDAVITGARSNILRIALGTNDVGSGVGEGAAAWANLSGMITSAFAGGFSHVIVDTMITNSNCDTTLAYETQRQAYNALIRANAAGMGYYVSDVGGSSSSLGVPGATASHPTLFSGDLLHPSEAGQAVIAQYDAAVLNTILSTSAYTPPAAQNLILQSEAIATTPWVTFTNASGSLTRTNNAALAPDGSMTATEIMLSRSSHDDYAQIYQEYVTGAATYATAQWFKAKAAGDVGKQIIFLAYDGTSVTAIATVTLTAAWQKVVISGAMLAFATSQTAFGFSGFNGSLGQTGTVEFYTWGAQVSQGATLATYAKTTTTTVP